MTKQMDSISAARLLEKWPTIHSMDDPDMWEPTDFPFVRNALEAIIFAASFCPETIKRWWSRYLHKAGEASQWVAGELIRAGVNEDLLRSHSQGVNPTYRFF